MVFHQKPQKTVGPFLSSVHYTANHSIKPTYQTKYNMIDHIQKGVSCEGCNKHKKMHFNNCHCS